MVVHRVVPKLNMLVLMSKYHRCGIFCRPYEVTCQTFNTIFKYHSIGIMKIPLWWSPQWYYH